MEAIICASDRRASPTNSWYVRSILLGNVVPFESVVRRNEKMESRIVLYDTYPTIEKFRLTFLTVRYFIENCPSPVSEGRDIDP